MSKKTDRLVTVCSKCKQSSCFQGEFYCESYKNASVKYMKVSELAKLALEHPSYWDVDS